MPLRSTHHAANATSLLAPAPPSADFSNSFFFVFFLSLFSLASVLLIFLLVFACAQPDSSALSDYGSDEESLWTWSEGEDGDVGDRDLPPPYQEFDGVVFGLARGELGLALEELPPPPSYEVAGAEAAGEAAGEAGFGAPFLLVAM